MIIPIEQLAADTLTAIIEDFILREGTDYGANQVELADKISQVRQQLQQGTVVIVYSELYETINLMPAEQFYANNNMPD